MYVTSTGAITGGVGTTESYWWPLDDARPTGLGWIGGEGRYIDGIGMVFVVDDYPKGSGGSIIRWWGDPKLRRAELYGTPGRKPRKLLTAGPYWIATRNLETAALYESWGEVYSGTFDSNGAALGGGYSGPQIIGLQDDGSYCAAYYDGAAWMYVVYWNDGTQWTVPSGYRVQSLWDDHVMCYDDTTSASRMAVFDRSGTLMSIASCAANSITPVQPLVIENVLWLLYAYEHSGRRGLVLHRYNDASKLYLIPDSQRVVSAHARVVGGKLVVAFSTGVSESAVDVQRHLVPIIPQSRATVSAPQLAPSATSSGAVESMRLAYQPTLQKYGATVDTTNQVRFRVYHGNQITIESDVLVTDDTESDRICSGSSCVAGGTDGDPCWLITYTTTTYVDGDYGESTKYARFIRMADNQPVVGARIELADNTRNWYASESSVVWDGAGFVVPVRVSDSSEGPFVQYVRVLLDGTIAHSLEYTSAMSCFGAGSASAVRLYPQGTAISSNGVICSVGIATWEETAARLVWAQRFTISGGNIVASGDYIIVSADSTFFVSEARVVWDGNRFVIVWLQNGATVVSTLGLDGVATATQTIVADGGGDVQICAVAGALPPVVVSRDADSNLYLYDLSSGTPYQLSSGSRSDYRAHITANPNSRQYLVSMIAPDSVSLVTVNSQSTGVSPIYVTHDPVLSSGVLISTPTTYPSTGSTATSTTATATALLTGTRVFRSPTTVTPPPAILSRIGAMAPTILPSSTGTLNEEPPSYAAVYPYNHILHAGESGHLIEVDDTPGAERIHVYHRSGSHIEMRPDGGVKYKSTKKRQDVTIGDHEIIVQGDFNITVDGGSRILVRNGELVLEAQYGAAVNVKGQLKVSADNIELKAKNNIFLNAPSVDLGGFPPGNRPMISLPGGVLPYPPPGPTSIPVAFIPRVNMGLAGGVGSVDLFKKMPKVETIVASPVGMVSLFKQHLKDTSGEPLYSELTTQPTIIPLSNPKLYTGNVTAESVRIRERQFDTPEDVDDAETYAAHVGICIEKGDYASTDKDLPGQWVMGDDIPPTPEPVPYRAFVLGSGGTVTCLPGDKLVVGHGTKFTEDVEAGQTLLIDGTSVMVGVVQTDTELLLRDPWPMSETTAVPFVFRLRPIKEFFQQYTYARTSPLGSSGLSLGDMLPNFTSPVIEVPRTVSTTMVGGLFGSGQSTPESNTAPIVSGGAERDTPATPTV